MKFSVSRYHNMVKIYHDKPHSAKRWRRKTLANQKNIALAKKLWQITNLEDQAEI